MDLDYVGQLRSNGDLFATAAARDLDAHVPSCPEWNVARLTIHLGQHHRWVANAINGGGEVPADPPKPGLRGDDLVDWLRQGVSDLAELLERSDDETPAWSWAGDNRVGFWRRRTSLETLIHRWDAENATGETTSLDPQLSSDCVDEMFFIMVPEGGERYEGASLTASVALSDAPGLWTLRLTDGELPDFARTEGDASTDVRLEGSAEDMALFLWGRVDQKRVSVSGERELVESFIAWMR